MLLFICLLLFSIAVGKGWYQVSPRKMLAAVWGMMILAPAMMLGTGMLAEYQVKRLQAWLGYGEPSYAAQTAYECLRTSRLLGASGNHVWQKLPGWNSEYILVSLTSAYGLLAAGDSSGITFAPVGENVPHIFSSEKSAGDDGWLWL